MRKTKSTIVLKMGFVCMLTTLAFIGCSSKKTASNSGYGYAPETWENAMSEEAMYDTVNDIGVVMPENAETLLAENMHIDNRKLIKTLNIDMQTMEFDKTTSSITAIVNELGGYIEHSNISGNYLNYAGNYSEKLYNPRNANFVLRIPVERLDTASDRLATLGNITNRSESVEDVTSNYTDVERRLETLRVQEERLLEMLKTADELEYMITLEKELSNVRYEIESYTIHLNSLDNQISYSFVYIYVNEVIEYDDVRIAPPTFGERLANGFSKSIRAIADFGQALAVILVTIIPFLVVWGGILSLIIVAIIKCKKVYRQKYPKVLRTQTKPDSIPKVNVQKGKQEKSDFEE